MAAVATMPTLATMSARRPFAPLGESRLRNLGNIKNTQNAIVPTIEKAIKRSYESSGFDDAENIDPTVSLPPNKKTKGCLDDVKPSKYVLTTTTNASARPKLPLKTRRIAKPAQPIFSSVPAPAAHAEAARIRPGRSPVKPKGLMSNRRKATRVNPPGFADDKGVSLPFSLDSALSGTVGSYEQKRETKPAHMPNRGGNFIIYEESEDEQMGTILSNGTTRMDISDDEGSMAKDNRGKENIPPTEGLLGVSPTTIEVPATRRNMMTDGPRSPLGDLDAAAFYANGTDATSWFIIPADDVIAVDNVIPVEKFAPVVEEVSKEASPIDIWESESCKGEEAAETEPQSDCI